MKATEEMSELRAAIEAAGASPALTHCTILAGELAARIKDMQQNLDYIAGKCADALNDDDYLPGRVVITLADIQKAADDALKVPEYPKPRSFGRSNTKVSEPGT